MGVSRRKFLQLSSLASASLLVPRFLKAFEYRPELAAGNRALVVLQLSGGNDGLNTVVPYTNDVYYKNRPQIAIKKGDALALDSDAGLHPALKGMKQLYDDGGLCILNGVGYPEPNRSHFRSMDIWQSGSSADELVTTGWLGRYADGACADCNMHNSIALELDDSLSLAMKGARKNGLAVKDVNRFRDAAASDFFRQLASHKEEHDARLAGYLYQTLRETISAADYLYAQNKIYQSTQTYPNTALGKQLKTIAELITAHAETKVYYVSHGSFDTHVNQADRQHKLFEQLDEGLTAFVADLKKNNRYQDVLVMTFSEFGRRVSQNASNGTDHGTASSMFLLSGALQKQGLYNPLPSLTDLDDGDLKYSIDFKQVYATILDKWLGGKHRDILGADYERLRFV